ncbi:MAG: tetratricopeptide repeat protein [Planctomycetales bacterium]|nr:tetratricopeptide repeat protein [bacterium]UNM07002.1 MAG: tetratricopeptide repeat protein [Planctomycetales bacterium]
MRFILAAFNCLVASALLILATPGNTAAASSEWQSLPGIEDPVLSDLLQQLDDGQGWLIPWWTKPPQEWDAIEEQLRENWNERPTPLAACLLSMVQFRRIKYSQSAQNKNDAIVEISALSKRAQVMAPDEDLPLIIGALGKLLSGADGAEIRLPLHQVLERSPGSLMARYVLAVEGNLNGRQDEAIAMLAALLREYPDNLLLNGYYSSALIEAGQLEDARRVADQMLEIDPGNHDAYDSLRAISELKADWEPAADYAGKMLEIQPNVISSHERYIQDLQNAGMDDSLTKAVNTALRFFDDSSYLLGVKGSLLLTVGEFERAESVLRKALELNQGNYQAMSLLGSCLMHLGNAEEGLPLLSKAAEAVPDDYNSRFRLAIGYGMSGDLAMAVEILNQLIEEDPTDGLSYFNLANAYHLAGNDQAALKYARLAATFLKDDPANLVDAQKLIKELEK